MIPFGRNTSTPYTRSLNSQRFAPSIQPELSSVRGTYDYAAQNGSSRSVLGQLFGWNSTGNQSFGSSASNFAMPYGNTYPQPNATTNAFGVYPEQPYAYNAYTSPQYAQMPNGQDPYQTVCQQGQPPAGSALMQNPAFQNIMTLLSSMVDILHTQKFGKPQADVQPSETRLEKWLKKIATEVRDNKASSTSISDDAISQRLNNTKPIDKTIRLRDTAGATGTMGAQKSLRSEYNGKHILIQDNPGHTSINIESTGSTVVFDGDQGKNTIKAGGKDTTIDIRQAGKDDSVVLKGLPEDWKLIQAGYTDKDDAYKQGYITLLNERDNTLVRIQTEPGKHLNELNAPNQEDVGYGAGFLTEQINGIVEFENGTPVAFDFSEGQASILNN